MESDHKEIHSDRRDLRHDDKTSKNYWSVLLIAMILALFFSAVLIFVPAPISYKNVELQQLDIDKVKFYTETQQIHLVIKFGEATDTISSLMDYYYFIQEKTNMAVLNEEPVLEAQQTSNKSEADVIPFTGSDTNASNKNVSSTGGKQAIKLDPKRQTRGGEFPTHSPLIEVEERPSFPGGKPELEKFIARNKRTPYPLKSRNIKGSVNLRFIVNANGSISDIRILKGLGHGCEEEAIRLIELMPTWKAARNQGKTVAVYEALSIPF